MRLNFFTTTIILLILLSPASARAQQRDSNSNTATVGGRVTVEGKPAARVVVILSGPEGYGSRQFAGETDAERRFKIAGLAPGYYEIRPHAYVFVLANQSPYSSANRRIVVRAGETIDDISIELVRGGVVTGRVIDEAGRPVVGDVVRLLRPPGDRPPRTPSGYEPPSVAGKTDDRGIYRLFGVPPGRYLVVVIQLLDDGIVRGGGSFGYAIFYPNTTDPDKAKVIEVSAGEEKTEINITVVLP